jgi:hypothetical protein
MATKIHTHGPCACFPTRQVLTEDKAKEVLVGCVTSSPAAVGEALGQQ